MPQKVVGNLEVGTDGVDFMNEVLDTDDAELAESLLDDFVVESASSSCRGRKKKKNKKKRERRREK